MMRRSGINPTTAATYSSSAPTSGDNSLSTCSSNGGGDDGGGGGSSFVVRQQNRRRRQRREDTTSSLRPRTSGKYAGIIRLLLLIASLLALLDLYLYYNKTYYPHRHHPVSKSTIMSPEEHDAQMHQHVFVQRGPPIPMQEHDDHNHGEDSDHDNDVENDNDNEEEEEDDKEPIYEILRQANIDPSSLDEATKRQLPSWSKIQQLYGTEPRMYGLDTCDTFQQITEPSLTFLAMAGAFNSGTNLLAALLLRNCQMLERMKVYGTQNRGIRWQVKYGKHTPAKYRENHVTSTDKDVPLQYTLPLVTIRDPYTWMQSMCRHPYEVHWEHNATTCPHVVCNDQTQQTSPVQVNYATIITHHDSLPQFWNEWYNDYLQADWPRVIVRMEDLIFHGKNVTETLCKCGGGSPRYQQFKHISKSAKLGTAQHGNDKTSLVDAIIRYGTDATRLKGMTPIDLQVTRELLDPNLMALFDYHYA